MIEINKLYNQDCLIGMRDIDDKSIDCIICDLPYNKTKSSWDILIPIDKLWIEYKRIIKDNGAICLTSIQPFTSLLISSNLSMFKYEWIWNKKKPSNFLLSKVMPMMITESILIFCAKTPKYNPQMTTGKLRDKSANNKEKFKQVGYNGWGNVDFKQETNINDQYYPKNIIEISNANQRGKLHPTQKPVELMEYLIKTYTNENMLILDNAAGSGTTLLAAKNLKRNYIGFEKDLNYYNVACERIGQVNEISVAIE